MYLPSLVSLLAFVPGFVSAVPTAPEISKRACTDQWPDLVVTISATAVEYGLITLSRSDGPGSNNRVAGITFNNVPAGATGCMLNFRIPPVTSPNQFAVGSNTFDVWGVSSPITSSTTWNTLPQRTTQWATMNMPEWVQPDPFQTVLMSNTCSQTMSFLLQLSDWQQGAGEVHIPQDGVQYGFWLTYNC